MNVREEDRPKSNCPSRGLGLAAAAIGVGVGAALYYLFTKQPENPHGEGSTTGWACQEQTLNQSPAHECNDSYFTISEGSTTDTSIISETPSELIRQALDNTEHSCDYSNSSFSDINSDSSHDDSNESCSWYMSSDGSDESLNISDSEEVTPQINVSLDLNSNRYDDPSVSQVRLTRDTDSEVSDWDVTGSSLYIPDHIPVYVERTAEFMYQTVGRIWEQLGQGTSPSSVVAEEQSASISRQEAFRGRSWSLEECSICFEVLLRDQQVTSLPCTHRFHEACIGPWLREQQTCPNCRKTA